MNAFSVAQTYEQTQDRSSRIGEVVQFKGNQILCPMCEDWHENNTNCQRND